MESNAAFLKSSQRCINGFFNFTKIAKDHLLETPPDLQLAIMKKEAERAGIDYLGIANMAAGDVKHAIASGNATNRGLAISQRTNQDRIWDIASGAAGQVKKVGNAFSIIGNSLYEESMEKIAKDKEATKEFLSYFEQELRRDPDQPLGDFFGGFPLKNDGTQSKQQK